MCSGDIAMVCKPALGVFMKAIDQSDVMDYTLVCIAK